MNRRFAHVLLRVYPRPWRARYGEEFVEVLDTCRGGPITVLNVLRAGLRERWAPTVNVRCMPLAPSASVLTLARQPSAFIPMLLAVTALALLVVRLLTVGIAPRPDEGTTAHLWQLLMVCQVPLITWFALRWLRKAPGRALVIITVQLTLMLAALAPVFILHL